jgi:hypothetical protein
MLQVQLQRTTHEDFEQKKKNSWRSIKLYECPVIFECVDCRDAPCFLALQMWHVVLLCMETQSGWAQKAALIAQRFSSSDNFHHECLNVLHIWCVQIIMTLVLSIYADTDTLLLIYEEWEYLQSRPPKPFFCLAPRARPRLTGDAPETPDTPKNEAESGGADPAAAP